jgi:hypothetical protein
MGDIFERAFYASKENGKDFSQAAKIQNRSSCRKIRQSATR